MTRDRPSQDRQSGRHSTGRRGPLRLIVAIFLALVPLCSAPPLFAQTQSAPLPKPPAFDVKPDYTGLASNFLTGVTGWSPEALGHYLDAQALADIGVSLSSGDYAGASSKTLTFTGEKVVGVIPVIGQWYALGQAGSQLGNWAINHFGSDRFETAYQSLSGHFSEGDWNLAYGDGKLDTELVIVENANLLTFIDKQTGGGHSHAELRKMFWTMLQAKHRFESLCDQFGLTGAERTYENLAARYQQKLELTAQVAQVLEAERVAAEKARREEAWRKEQEWQAKKKAEEEARNAQTCAAWLGKIPYDPDHHLPRPDDAKVEELCGEKPPAPATQPADAPGQDDSQPAAPASDIDTAKAGMAGDMSWALAASAGDNRTVFRLTLTNAGARTIGRVGISAAPSGPYENGGVIAGASRRDLAPGQSAVFEAIASGGVKLTEIGIETADGRLATLVRASLHETGTPADGHYSGGYTGMGNNGTISLTIEGRAVRGTLTGGYADADQTLSISCAITGSYDPATGTLSAEWAGMANGRYTGENGAVIAEPLAGTLAGAVSKGGFSGSWTGGSQYLQDSGEWSASP